MLFADVYKKVWPIFKKLKVKHWCSIVRFPTHGLWSNSPQTQRSSTWFRSGISPDFSGHQTGSSLWTLLYALAWSCPKSLAVLKHWFFVFFCFTFFHCNESKRPSHVSVKQPFTIILSQLWSLDTLFWIYLVFHAQAHLFLMTFPGFCWACWGVGCGVFNKCNMEKMQTTVPWGPVLKNTV